MCKLNAFPAYLLSECLDTLLPCITAVFNSSQVSGIFPPVYKSALVKPLLKKLSFDNSDLKELLLCPTCLFCQVLEKIILSQLNEHLNYDNLLSPLQSLYRPNHGTETALLRIFNDPAALNNNRIHMLTLPDLLVAFDIKDHQILLTRFQHSFGIFSSALSWLRSYLAEHKQSL